MLYRLTRPSDLYTQRNNNDDNWTPENDQDKNKGDQNSACNVTSIINAAVGVAGYPESFFPGHWKGHDFSALKQPENRLHEILSTPEAYKFRDENCGISASPPYYYPKCLVWALNEIKPGTARLLWLKTSSILSFLEKRYGVVILGRFRTIHGSWLYHFTSISGHDMEPDRTINGWLIDDSWGNHETGYEKKDGDDCYLTAEKFRKDVVDYDSDSKMIILITPYGGARG